MTKRNEPLHLPSCYCTGIHEAGCDEAGRGCLAGPVYAAAVILPDGFTHPWLNDSKSEAVAYGIGVVDNSEIDRINILRASILAMHRALDALSTAPGAVIVDGNRFTPWRDVPWQTFVKGDGRFGNIAAASVLAKTGRDAFMDEAAHKYPMYHWESNKGYPTADHRAAIARYGPSPLHRMTFRLLPDPTLPGL